MIKATMKEKDGFGENGANQPSETQVLRDLIMGFRATQIIATAAKLDLAEHLGHGPQTSVELAHATNTNERRLYRLLRALTHLGILELNRDARFSLSPMGNLLHERVPGSLRHVAILYGEEWLWGAYAQLAHSMKSDKPAFEYVYGQTLYDYLKENAAAAEKFNKAMTAFSDHEAEAVKNAYDFSTANTIVDVGGGQGFFVLSLLKTHPYLKGVVFDLPGVVNNLDDVILREKGNLEITYVAGDFFQEVYKGGVVYMLKSVLHNWDEPSCIAILENCYKAMPSTGRLLIVERVISDGTEKSEAILFDINMLVMTEGQERTRKEYESLLDISGFSLNRIIATKSPVSILECFKKDSRTLL